MVEETGYNARVRVQAGAALPGVSADSMGAGVGDAIAQAGAVVQQERLEDARLDRQLRDNAEWSAFLVEDAKAREELSAAAREARLSDEPGHAERIAKELQTRQEALLGTLSSERLKQQGRARLAEWGGSLRAREADYEFLRGQEIAVEAFEEQRGIAEGRVRRLDKPDDYRAELKLQVDAINGLNTSDKVKQALIDETEQRFGVAFIRGMTDRDPEAARALIDSGAFDGVISGDQVEALRNGADVEIRRVQAEREREQSEALANLRGQIATFKQAESMGLIEDDAAYDQAIASAQALGKDDLVLELTGLKANKAFTRVWGPGNATALQREQRIAALAAQDKRTAEENLELAYLRKNAPGWASEEARDPVTQAARRGGAGAPPVIDLGDGASWNARADWMNGRGAASGFMEVELRELQQQLGTPAGELQVMEQLDKVRDPYARSRMAQQLAPNDPTFQTMAMLRPGVRATVRQGRKAMAGNAKFFSNLDPGVEAKLSDLDSRITYALREYDDDLKLGTRETVRQFIAGNLAAQGRPDASTFVDGEGAERTMKSAVAHALGGGYVMRGGQRFLLGGIEDWAGRAYVLPPNINEAEFKRRLQVDLTSTKNPPVNPDGSVANLYRLVPVAIGGGAYRFEDRSGTPVKAKNGQVYTFKAAQ